MHIQTDRDRQFDSLDRTCNLCFSTKLQHVTESQEMQLILSDKSF